MTPHCSVFRPLKIYWNWYLSLFIEGEIHTISSILYRTNWIAHSRFVTSRVLFSPFGPSGRSIERVLPIDRETSTRNMDTVYCIAIRFPFVWRTRRSTYPCTFCHGWIKGYNYMYSCRVLSCKWGRVWSRDLSLNSDWTPTKWVMLYVVCLLDELVFVFVGRAQSTASWFRLKLTQNLPRK